MTVLHQWSKWKRTKHLRFHEELVPGVNNDSRVVKILQQRWKRTIRLGYGEVEIERRWLDVGDNPNA